MTLCEKCQEARATVHQIQVLGDEVTHVPLCESCASEGVFGDTGDGPALQDVLSSLPARTDADEMVCSGCGRTYDEFTASGTLGCARCYVAFEDQLGPLIHRIHGADRHVDDETASTGLGKVSREQKLQVLEKRLEESVKQENYEEAARLRDRISELKEENSPERFSD